MRSPVLFLSHGAPTNAVLDNDFTRDLSALADGLPKPSAVVVVSAHWLTRGVHVTGAERPETIHDFFGFPKELYEIRYEPPGAIHLIPALKELVSDGLAVDHQRGLDHGVWSVLRHLYPKADVPVLQISIDTQRDAVQHYLLARALRPLRDQDVLFIGSGNLTHNLSEADLRDIGAPPASWAAEFDEWASKAIQSGDDESILGMRAPDDLFFKNHPTTEHFVPLFYSLGFRDSKDNASFPHVGFQYGSLSMRCVAFS